MPQGAEHLLAYAQGITQLKETLIDELRALGDELYNLPPNDFLKLVLTAYTPQKYGIEGQRYIEKNFNLRRSDNPDAGDVRDEEGRYYEVKCSILSKTNKAWNIRQVRPHQEIDGYILMFGDLRDPRSPDSSFYMLSKEQMQRELQLCNAKPCHGTRSALENNRTIEYGFTISQGSEHHYRWFRNYSVGHPNTEA